MFLDLQNNRPVSSNAIRRAHPNTSLPRNPSDDTLAALGYARVHPTPRPDGDVVTEGQPDQGDDGKWYQTWEVRDFTPEEREANTPEPEYPQFTALEMLDLFTEQEQLAVVQATMSVPEVKLWYDRLIAATFVTYQDPRTEGGLQALVDAGLLDPGRKADIVAAMQPETEPT